MKMTFKVVFWGGLIVFFAVVLVAVFTPVAVWKPPTTTIAHPYTPEEAYGRQLFFSNGCNYCHTQYVREVDNGMGATSQGGDYNYDNPMVLGSERTGPDLSYVGRKRSMQWEIDHLKKPRSVSPLSIMPNFDFLSNKDLRAVGTYLFYLGDRNAAEFMLLSPASYADATLPLAGTALQSTDPSAPPQGWPTFKAAGLYEGKQIFASRCLTCHGCAGNGLGTYGGTLIVTPADFKVDPFRTMPDDQWFWHVSEGVQGSVMPPWKESLTVRQRWNVIHYIQQMYARPIERNPDEGDPPPDYQKTNPLPITIANIDAGKRIWTRECAVCHGDAARGEGIFRQGIEAVPPDFQNSGSAVYQSVVDADYFWRISEGVPWTAMPTWKVVYPETERWQLVTYVRSIFTQTVKKPQQPTGDARFATTDVMKNLTIPRGTGYDAGRQQFLAQCAHCHGLAGDGMGWDGQYLNPKPADLATALAPTVPGIQDHYDGKTFSKVTNGLFVTAMPTWGEFLTEGMRWADVKYLKGSFTLGTKGSTTSHYGKGDVPIDYVQADTGIFQSEIGTITPERGKPLYEKYCATCHGADGNGHGPGTKDLVSGSPAPLPKNMNLPYIFSATREGVPNTMMYGFQPLLTETEIWNVTAYVVGLTGRKFGG